MKKQQFKVVQYYSTNTLYGYVFEYNSRQFGLCNDMDRYYLYELESGAKVLSFTINELLNFSIEDNIDFAKYYISKISEDDFLKNIERVKQTDQFKYFQYPINQKFKV